MALFSGKPYLLFVTRKYPPAIGGMENYCYHLFNEISRKTPSRKISLGRSQIHLLWFYPYLFVHTLFLCLFRSVQHLHIGDGLLAPIGTVVGKLTGVPTSITVYGLDVTFRPKIYQWMIWFFLPRYEKIVCISQATFDECLKRGVDASRCQVIPCGVERLANPLADREEAIQRVQAVSGFSLAGKTILTSVGRLVPRKGVEWFIRNVMPKTPAEFVYLIAGDGSEREKVQSAIKETNLSGRVAYLGRIPDEFRDGLYAAADVFVMPNQKVPGDMEGFGIVAIEAGLRKLPVVASGIEGILDAVIEGETGFLVDENSPEAFIEGFEKARHLDREKLPSRVFSRYHWDKIAEDYLVYLGLKAKGAEPSARVELQMQENRLG